MVFKEPFHERKVILKIKLNLKNQHEKLNQKSTFIT
jgi:hypothetical protein